VFDRCRRRLAAPESALDALAAEEPATDDATRLDRVRRLATAGNRLDAQLTAAVRAAENHQVAEYDGLTSMRSWLRTHTRIPDGAAKRLIETGRALEHLPVAERAFACGAIGAEQVAAIAPITTPPHLGQAAEAAVDVAAVEAELVGIAQQVSHQRLRAAVHFYTERLDPDGTEPDPTEGRSFTMSRLLGGTWTGTFVLDEIGGEKLATAIEAITITGQQRAALRAAPHQGPPRLPRRTRRRSTTRSPMAHLPPRRHPDPPPPPPARRLTRQVGCQGVLERPTVRHPSGRHPGPASRG